MFLAQTWLVTNGLLSDVGDVGLGLMTLSLAQWTIDWGGLVLLSRHAAESDDTQYVIGANLVRMLMAVPVTVALLLSVYLFPVSPMLHGILWGGSGIIFFWACNLSGYLDGKGCSYYSGLIGNLSWLVASLSIFAIKDIGTYQSGLVIGLSYLFGGIVTVILQYALASFFNVQISPGLPKTNDMIHFFREGLVFNFANILTQIYSRGLVVVVKFFLGAEVGGIYVYIRNVISSVMQGISFVKRVEFPKIVKLARANKLNVIYLIQTQYWSIGASFLFFISILVGYFSLNDKFLIEYRNIMEGLLFFASVVPVWSISSAMGQITIALERLDVFAKIISSGLSLSIMITVIFIERFGLYVIVASEIAMFIFQILLYVHWVVTRDVKVSPVQRYAN